MRISQIVEASFVDGPGERVVLFMQGCPIHCPGCQSPHTWPLSGPKISVSIVAAALLALSEKTGNVTISGGEPSMQALALAELVFRLKQAGRHIVLYSGYTFEQLRRNGHMDAVWPFIDVLVDGPFIQSKDDDFVAWRGSRNQRPIDIPATLASGQVVLLDWGDDYIAPITITGDGSVVLPAGLASEFKEIGQEHTSPMCGQTGRNP